MNVHLFNFINFIVTNKYTTLEAKMNTNVENTNAEKVPLPTGADDDDNDDSIASIDFANKDGRPSLNKRRSTVKFNDDNIPSNICHRRRRRLTSPPPPYGRRSGRRVPRCDRPAAPSSNSQAMNEPNVANNGGDDQPGWQVTIEMGACCCLAVLVIGLFYTWVISRQFPNDAVN